MWVCRKLSLSLPLSVGGKLTLLYWDLWLFPTNINILRVHVQPLLLYHSWNQFANFSILFNLHSAWPLVSGLINFQFYVRRQPGGGRCYSHTNGQLMVALLTGRWYRHVSRQLMEPRPRNQLKPSPGSPAAVKPSVTLLPHTLHEKLFKSGTASGAAWQKLFKSGANRVQSKSGTASNRALHKLYLWSVDSKKNFKTNFIIRKTARPGKMREWLGLRYAITLIHPGFQLSRNSWHRGKEKERRFDPPGVRNVQLLTLLPRGNGDALHTRCEVMLWYWNGDACSRCSSRSRRWWEDFKAFPPSSHLQRGNPPTFHCRV